MSIAGKLQSDRGAWLVGFPRQAGTQIEQSLHKLGYDVRSIDSLSGAGLRLGGRETGLVLLWRERSPASAAQVARAAKAAGAWVGWIVESGADTLELPIDMPLDFVAECPISHSSFAACIEELREPTIYGAWMRTKLASWATAVLRDGFGVETSTTACFLKCTRRLLGDINALIPFVGLTASGRMIVSSSREPLASIVAHSLGSGVAADDGQLYGLVGELGNLALGRAQREFRRLRADFALGHPLPVRGDQFRLPDLADRPSMVCRVRSGTGSVDFELYLERGPIPPSEGREPARPDEPGATERDEELLFFDGDESD